MEISSSRSIKVKVKGKSFRCSNAPVRNIYGVPIAYGTVLVDGVQRRLVSHSSNTKNSISLKELRDVSRDSLGVSVRTATVWVKDPSKDEMIQTEISLYPYNELTLDEQLKYDLHFDPFNNSLLAAQEARRLGQSVFDQVSVAKNVSLASAVFVLDSTDADFLISGLPNGFANTLAGSSGKFDMLAAAVSVSSASDEMLEEQLAVMSHEKLVWLHAQLQIQAYSGSGIVDGNVHVIHNALTRLQVADFRVPISNKDLSFAVHSGDPQSLLSAVGDRFGDDLAAVEMVDLFAKGLLSAGVGFSDRNTRMYREALTFLKDSSFEVQAWEEDYNASVVLGGRTGFSLEDSVVFASYGWSAQDTDVVVSSLPSFSNVDDVSQHSRSQILKVKHALVNGFTDPAKVIDISHRVGPDVNYAVVSELLDAGLSKNMPVIHGAFIRSGRKVADRKSEVAAIARLEKRQNIVEGFSAELQHVVLSDANLNVVDAACAAIGGDLSVLPSTFQRVVFATEAGFPRSVDGENVAKLLKKLPSNMRMTNQVVSIVENLRHPADTAAASAIVSCLDANEKFAYADDKLLTAVDLFRGRPDALVSAGREPDKLLYDKQVSQIADAALLIGQTSSVDSLLEFRHEVVKASRESIDDAILIADDAFYETFDAHDLSDRQRAEVLVSASSDEIARLRRTFFQRLFPYGSE